MLRKLCLFVFLCGLGTSADGQFVHAKGKLIVDGSGKELHLHGTNLGNWMVPEGYMFRFDGGPQSPREIEELVNDLLGPAKASEFWQQYRANYVTQRDVAALGRAGVNVLRVPLHYKFFEEGNDEGFRLVDRLSGWAKQAGVYLILDLHCAPGGQTGTNIDDSWGYPWLYESEQEQKQTVKIWRRIAAHYRDNPTVLGYDLLNEPIPHYPKLQRLNPYLEPLYKRLTAAVREVDRNHMVIFGGAQWDSNFKVFGTPFDDNSMYTFHKYWTQPTKNVIQEYLDFRDKYDVPIYMGESGENSDEWISSFRKVLDENDIAWTFWPYKKMEAPSAVMTFSKPMYWDEVIAYAKLSRRTGDAEKSVAARPSEEHIQAAFADLLQKIQFEECHRNEGYVMALGLR